MPLVQDDLKKLFDRCGASPFLFVGSGIGRRYLGLPNWEELLRVYAAQTPQPYEYYVTEVGGDDYPGLGSAIARAFRDVWWTSPEFEAARAARKGLMADYSSPLKVEVAEQLRRRCETLSTDGLPDELTLLADAQIDGIVTTNYDTIMEAVFPDFDVYRSQDETLFRVSHGVGEIFKIHGCLTDPNTMVLTSEDYQRFDERNAYLAAKLTTLFLEHPFVFMGYSITDANVQAILRSILTCLPPAQVGMLHDRLVFVEYTPGAGEGEAVPHSLSVGKVVLPVTRVRAESFVSVYEALAATERKIPASVLRKVKERVYSLVRTTDPKGSLHVVDLEDGDTLDDVDVVVGVGMVHALSSKGYEAVSRADLLNEVLDDDAKFDPDAVVDVVLPRILKGNTWAPVWGYLSRRSGTGAVHSSVSDFASKSLDDFRSGNPYWKSRKGREFDEYAGIADLDSREPLSRSVYLAPLLPEGSIDASELRTYLQKHRAALDSGKSYVSYLVKLVCLLDFLEHR